MLTRIATPNEFLTNVVEVDVLEFANSPGDLRLAYHACISLLSLRDWVLEERKNQVWKYHGAIKPALSSKTKFQTELAEINNAFNVVTDVANATKHMTLRRNQALTDMVGNANVHIVSTSTVGVTPVGQLTCGHGQERIFAHIGSNYHDLLTEVQNVDSIWQELFVENAW